MVRRGRSDKGFTLVEMVLSLAVLLLICSAGFMSMSQLEKSYLSSTTLGTMYSTVRNAAGLITQEVGQAGAVCGAFQTAGTGVPVACSGTTVSAAVATGATTVTLASTTGLYAGEKLTFDPDSALGEVVTVGTASGTTVTLPTGKSFSYAHSSGVPVGVAGLSWRGILVPESTSTTLKLFGDINGDGTLYYVEYNCDFTNGVLTRSSTPITASAKNTADTLIDNLIFIAPTGYTGSSYCFTYVTPTAVRPDSNGTTYRVATQVGLLISVQSPNIDPQTKKRWQFTKAFLDLSPRNVVAAYDLASNSVYSALQPLPASSWFP